MGEASFNIFSFLDCEHILYRMVSNYYGKNKDITPAKDIIYFKKNLHNIS